MNEKREDSNGGVQIIENEEPNGEPTCKIYFENSPNRVYFAGQVVNGCVNLGINDPVTVRAIYANIVGQGHAQCTTSSGRHRTSSTHMKDEFYINKKMYYIGGQNTSGRVTVQSGDYKYLFNCEIPEDCHTSVEEDTGFIRYSVTLVIEEDVDVKKEFTESFTVINELNLNVDETYSYPMSDETELTFTKYCCCLCCWITEPVKISVKIPTKGYAPGQAIEITINIDNKSDQSYDKFIGNIFKKIDFYANERTSSSKEVITTAECEGCLAGESISRKLIIIVPPTPRTETSNICSISYELTVGAFSDICRDDPSIVFPLTIGTYPIDKTNTQTDGIIVTQQPVGLLNEDTNQIKLNSKMSNEPSQSQPLLSDENSSSTGLRKIETPDFKIGESSRSDKELENTYRPLYPVYRSNQFPLPCNLKVESVETNKELKFFYNK